MLHYAPLLAWIALVLITADYAKAEPIRLHLASGRQMTGEVSPRTSHQQFWFVQRVGRAQLSRPIAWNHIVAAEFRHRQWTSDALEQLLMSEVSPVVASASLSQVAPSDTEENPFQDDPPAIEKLTPLDREGSSVTLLGQADLKLRVASVRFDAHIANWDADVEADGLVVQIVPVDTYGQVVQVRGALQVELFGVRRVAFQDAPAKRGRSHERLGFWTQQVAPDYVYSDGGWFKLPFQAVHPEFDARTGYLGLVHVRLVVPGAGVFEDSLDGIRLRPFAPLRDSLERDTGQRFFPSETTGRGQRMW